ncbi:MAG: LUD domain-containing protein [Butyricicoccus sp.]|nr:LUD domain-containing protein [Butyricicoccus sp.]MBQ8584853.1 LUD domain-containing protein [Butyricicoccus sp.]
MQTAKNAGLLAIGVTWGFRSRDDLEAGGADIIISHPSELAALLTGGLQDIDRVEEAFTRNGFAFRYFDTKEEAAAYLREKCAGRKSCFGGSMTLDALKLYEWLKDENEDVTWHWRKDEIRSAGDVFLTSANALSETGEIVNIDGNCNRIADAMWGFKECYVVCGCNKLAPDLSAAMRRARKVAGPLNARRLNRKTPCAVTGVCSDCRSPERICKVMAITMQPPGLFEHYEIVLIGEYLGY